MTDLQSLPVFQLTDMYNIRVAVDKQIKKFSTKADAVRRVQALLDAEAAEAAKAAEAAEAEKTTAPKKAGKPRAQPGERRIDKLLAKLKEGQQTIEALSKEFNTTIGVIRNDIVDIRKMVGADKLVRDRKENTYTVKEGGAA